jgi:hypothetical protein
MLAVEINRGVDDVGLLGRVFLGDSAPISSILNGRAR